MMHLQAAIAIVLIGLAVGNRDVHSTDDHQVPAARSSSLSKFVITVSNTKAVNTTGAAIDDTDDTVTTCPPGRDGLACRRAEAVRGVESCPYGMCNACGMCAGAESAILWPNCCKHNGVCCAELARSCQSCDKPALLDFCKKHFKRCF